MMVGKQSIKDKPGIKYIYDKYNHFPVGYIENGVFQKLNYKFNLMPRSENALTPKLDKALKLFVLLTKRSRKLLIETKKLNIDKFNEYLHSIQKCFIYILSNDINVFVEKKIERIYWKNICHFIIDFYKDKSQDDQKILFIKQFINFYREAISHLTSKINSSLMDIIYIFNISHWEYCIKNILKFYYNSNDDGRNIIINSIHIECLYWFAIAMGDLMRYYLQDSANMSLEYLNTPCFWYNLALTLNPYNVTAYHQLCLVSTKANQSFDTFYYYIRIIMLNQNSSHSLLFNLDNLGIIDDTHNKLLAFFQENHKVYNASQKKQSDIFIIAYKVYLTYIQFVSKKDVRLEVINSMCSKSVSKNEFWIEPNFEQNIENSFKVILNIFDVKNTEILLCPYLILMLRMINKIPPRSLPVMAFEAWDHKLVAKYFILYFINLHGKLYTKTDLDNFEQISRYCVIHFKGMLNYLFDSSDYASSQNIVTSFNPSSISIESSIENIDLDKCIEQRADETHKNIISMPNTLYNSFLVSNPLRLLQILIINVASISKLYSDANQKLVTCQNTSLELSLAFSLGMEFFKEISNYFITNFQVSFDDNSSESLAMLKCLVLLLPYLNLWIRWMNYNFYQHVPALQTLNKSLQPFKILKRLKVVLTNPKLTLESYPIICSNQTPMLLLEEEYVSGFVPFEEIFNICEPNVEKVYNFTLERNGIKRIINESQARIAKVLSNVAELCVKLQTLYQNPPTNSKKEINVESIFTSRGGKSGNGSVLEELYNQLLTPEANGISTQLTLTFLKPRFLVFDTNCVIDHLKSIKNILNVGDFVVLFPSIVIGELLNLSNINIAVEGDNLTEKDIQKEYRKNCAKEAIHFLETTFTTNLDLKNLQIHDTFKILSPTGQSLEYQHYLKAVDGTDNLYLDFLEINRIHGELDVNETPKFDNELNVNLYKSSSTFNKCVSFSNKNSPLTKKQFKLSSPQSKYSFKKGQSTYNDDLILQSCIKLMRRQKEFKLFENFPDITLESNSRGYDKNVLRFVKRNVVFFTDDQNLKIKAHTMNIPTRVLQDFTEWLHIE